MADPTRSAAVQPEPEEMVKKLISLMDEARRQGYVETKASSEGLTLSLHVSSRGDKALMRSVTAMINQHIQ